MAWLIRDGVVLAAIEGRHAGWQRSLQGAVLLSSPALLQTVTTPCALDVAWCAPPRPAGPGGPAGPGSPACFRVRRVACLRPWRVTRPLLFGGVVVAAPAGAFDRWQLHPGDLLEVQGP